jgi:hypothetical protein
MARGSSSRRIITWPTRCGRRSRNRARGPSTSATMHKDHLDIDFLRTLPTQDLSLFIPPFRRTVMVEMLAPLGWKEIVVSTAMGVGGAELFLLVDDSVSNRDSAILVRAYGQSFLNFHDCKVYDRVTAFGPGIKARLTKPPFSAPPPPPPRRRSSPPRHRCTRRRGLPRARARRACRASRPPRAGSSPGPAGRARWRAPRPGSRARSSKGRERERRGHRSRFPS